MAALFRLANLVVLPFWGLMIFLPRWRWTVRMMRSPFVSVAPALFYAGLVLPRLGVIWPAVSRPSLSAVANLLGSPEGTVIAWVHFLAFDLFVGRWIYLDSHERRLSRWLTAPVLFLTLMLGPLGFLSYLMIRTTAHPAAAGTGSAPIPSSSRAEKQPFAGAQLERALGKRYGNLLRRMLSVSPPLTILGGAMLIVLLATLAGLGLDPRVITGTPAWLKPAKFAISISVYCFTFAWLLGLVENHPRLTRLAANVTVISFIVEMTAIVTQAARGTTSHFNMTTPFNSFLWTTMGTFIVLVWAMNLLLAILLVRQRMPDRAFAWSLRLGLLISFVGMATAFLMVRPTPVQVAAITQGHAGHIVGGHNVGVADGGPGLPILGWSTVAGDLRVAHFVGLHGLQLLPFVGWLVTRRRGMFTRLAEGHRLAFVWTAALGYLGLVLLLVWQALRGESVIDPHRQTLVATGALASLAGISTLIATMHAWRANRRPGSLDSPVAAGHVDQAMKV